MTACPLSAVPGCGLGHVPMLNDAGGEPLGDVEGGAVGVGVPKVPGEDDALAVAVGASVGPPEGDDSGLDDDDELGIADADDVGDALDPPLGGAVGDAPADAVDVGSPPGDALGATDGTTPPVYRSR